MTCHACTYNTKIYTLELQHQKTFLISEFFFFSIQFIIVLFYLRPSLTGNSKRMIVIRLKAFVP